MRSPRWHRARLRRHVRRRLDQQSRRALHQQAAVRPGANAGIDPNTGSRSAETIIEPGVSDPNPNDAAPTVVVYVASSGVTIDGVTVEGDNPNLTSTVIHNGANVDAAEGIAGFEGVGNINIINNIVRDTTYTGVDMDNYNNNAATAGNVISHNLLTNLGGGGFKWGIGVIVQDNFYADISHNVMSNVRIGVQTGNFNLANPWLDRRHQRQPDRYEPRRHRLQPALPECVSVHDFREHCHCGSRTSETQWDGIEVLSQQNGVDVTVSNNTIDGTGATARPAVTLSG